MQSCNGTATRNIKNAEGTISRIQNRSRQHRWRQTLRSGVALLTGCIALILSACGGGGGTGPAVSIANVSVVEGNGGSTTNLVFTVTLNTPSTSAVTVDYITTDGTALSASDYTATTATLTITAGKDHRHHHRVSRGGYNGRTG